MRISLLSIAMLASAPGTAAPAALPPGCEALGAPLLDHSCFHAFHGPFVSVIGTPGELDAADTPAVDAVHTYYDVALPQPGAPHVTTYRIASPARTGAWAIFHHPDVPLRVVAPDGTEVAPLLAHAVATCPGLATASVYALADVRYRLISGPAARARTYLVLEYLDDFVAFHGRDADGDGYGAEADSILTPCASPPGFAPNDLDCDDGDAARSPGAVERCGDALDSNCDGNLDDAGLACAAGAGACAATGAWTCGAAGSAAVCDATAGTPAAEACEGIDGDCDGVDDTREADLCADPGAPRCIRWLGRVACGCDDDAQCETGACDLGTQRCVEAPADPMPPADGGCNGSRGPGLWTLALIALFAATRRDRHAR